MLKKKKKYAEVSTYVCLYVCVCKHTLNITKKVLQLELLLHWKHKPKIIRSYLKHKTYL